MPLIENALAHGSTNYKNPCSCVSKLAFLPDEMIV